jgi:hypothetical protein
LRGVYPGAGADAAFFLDKSLDAVFSASFADGFAAVAVSPPFFAAALACAAFLLSSFAAANCLSLAEPLSCSGC